MRMAVSCPRKVNSFANGQIYMIVRPCVLDLTLEHSYYFYLSLITSKPFPYIYMVTNHPAPDIRGPPDTLSSRKRHRTNLSFRRRKGKRTGRKEGGLGGF